MKQTFVTQPFLPPLSEFSPYLQSIWENKILTNSGPFHQELEAKLCEFLGVKYISLFSNGTLALITALQALNINGEVITTPYSFVATSHSLLWTNNVPVFVDIDPKTMNMDPKLIEKAITSRTKAILPVHCYGYPCDYSSIDKIAKKHNLKVIYDSAHAFNVKINNESILNFGDLSVLSFHATKVFNTFEGGAIICHSKELKQRIDNLKNFGFTDETTVVEAGINAKMSEINSAFGLLQLKYINEAIDRRKAIDEYYREKLLNVSGLEIPTWQLCIQSNYSYFPILIDSNFNLSRDELYFKLKDFGINARRYFYPLISNFQMYKEYPSSLSSNLVNATQVAESVICLPIYPDLSKEIQDKIIDLILN